MKFHPRLAPDQGGRLPAGQEGRHARGRRARSTGTVKKPRLAVFYDEKGAVGRRYRRQDEAGTPFCITVDGQTLQDETVTIRDRDSLKQERIAAEKVIEYVRERIGAR